MWNLHVSMVGFLVSPAHCNVTGMKVGQGNYPQMAEGLKVFRLLNFFKLCIY
jgi:hypothetical protein